VATKKQKQRSDAARRGWETRRDNLAREKRADAARRGWETRRAAESRRQQVIDRRSQAAKKGWETKRSLEREQREAWKFKPTMEWIVEEPIDEVGGDFYA